MAEIPVEKKGGSAWWMWLVGLLVLLVIIWFIWQMFDRDRQRLNTTAPAAVTGAATTTTPTSAPGAVQPGGTAAGDRVTDAGAYASTSDKLSLVGREAVLSNVRVVRVVGPKTFTLASGSEEFLVLVDQDLNRAVGTLGQIDQGNTINLKGNFQRLQQDEINNIASNRFRDLTEQEREWLRKTQVYLHATEFGKVN